MKEKVNNKEENSQGLRQHKKSKNIVAIIGILAPIFLTIYYNERKSLVANEKITQLQTEVTKNDTINEHIKILYNEKEIPALYIVNISIKNNGNHEITKEDFYSDSFDIILDEDTKIYDVIVNDASDSAIIDDISTKIHVNGSQISISPFLLNENESFELLFTTNKKTKISYNFRINGIKRIKKFNKDPYRIFKNYIQFIYNIIDEECKFINSPDGKSRCINTGLLILYIFRATIIRFCDDVASLIYNNRLELNMKKSI